MFTTVCTSIPAVHRQQPDRGEHTVPAAHVVGHDKGLPALFVRHGLKHALVRVRRGDDALFGLFRAVLCVEQAAEHAECERWLQRCAGFGDHVQVKVHFAQLVKQEHQRVGRHGVAGEEDARVARLRPGPQQLHGALGAQIGPADSDHDQRFGAATDLGGGGQDLLQLPVFDALRQLQPAGELRAGTGVLGKRSVRCGRGCVIRADGVKERGRAR